jgi:hypothetical protein
MAVRIICESAELAVECLQAGQTIGLAVEPEVATDWLATATLALAQAACGVACCEAPAIERLAELGHAARSTKRGVVLVSLARGADAERLRQVALDLGVSAVAEVEALVSALRLLDLEIETPWTASLRELNRPERTRIQPAAGGSTRGGGQFVRLEGGMLGWNAGAGVTHAVGKARDVALALAALRDTDRESARIESSVDDVDDPAVIDILFGPRRALSDPASKAALVPYGIPVPVEELCASASRASSEANRIGYPVRISLASPDLRVWDHPDLAVDMVDNAARVRDTFRQLMGLAKSRLEEILPADPHAADRLLGAMVTATSEAGAQLGVRAWPLPRARVAMEIGFADPHGMASGDRTLAVLPAPLSSIERALRRLRGSALLFGGTAAQRKAHLEAIGDVLLRVSAFVNDLRDQVESVELRPLALLLDGNVEVREACVSVSDAFERSLSAPPAANAAR